MFRSEVIQITLFFCLYFSSCWASEAKIKIDGDSGTANTLPPLLLRPHHYSVESDIPDNNVIYVNETYTIFVWPKDESGANTTVAHSKITLVTKPTEIINIKRINGQNPNVMTLELTITEPQNPCIIYLVENDTPISKGMKLAAIEDGKIDAMKSVISMEVTEARIREQLEFEVILRDAFGRPTSVGSEHIKFVSSVSDISVLNIHRFEKEGNPEDVLMLNFAMNCSEVGDYSLNITYRGKPLTGSPLSFSYSPGAMDPEKSRVKGYGSWLAALRQPNIIYVQVLDSFSNEIISVPTKTSLQYENQEKGSDSAESSSPDAPEENLKDIHQKITLKGWNSRKQLFTEETLEYVVEYIGKSTWGIRYVVQQDNPDTIFLGIYYENSDVPVGGILRVFAQQPGFPYPPNTYKMLGPYPALPELLEPAPSAISTNPKNFRSYSLDKNGWLPAYYTSVSISDNDYRAELVGDFHVEKEGVYLFLCLGVERYTIDVPILRSGDVWNIHQLTEGHHSLQVSVLGKRDWNFDFQCRFETFSPLKAYGSESIIPDIINKEFMGDVSFLIQNLHTHPINDLDIKVIAVNDSRIEPHATIQSPNSIKLPPQEFTRVPVHINFTTTNPFQFPSESFLVIFALYSPSLQAKTQITATFRVRNISQPFQFSFIDTDGTHQTAIASAPTENSSNPAPIALVSHGGGVSVTTLAEYFPSFPNAWWLFPKGRTVIPHELGPLFESHSLAAIDGLINLLAKKQKIFENFFIDRDSIVSVGSHFHGGRGALALANHYPDRMLGVSGDSGWLKHGEPKLDHFVHPMISGILSWSHLQNEISMTSSNFRSIPFFAGSGQGDTAGYPWRMYYQQTLLEMAKVDARADSAVGMSYKKYATAAISPTKDVLQFVGNRFGKKKKLPKKFLVSSWNPAVYYGLGGVHISAFLVPMQLATIDVEIQGDLWLLNTRNCRSFELLKIASAPRASQILIDGAYSFMIDTTENISFVYEEGKWKEQKDKSIFRNMNQYGPVTRLYERPLTIVCGTNAKSEEIQLYQLFSVYIANELMKQHRLDISILSDVQYLALNESQQTNIFLMGGPNSNKLSHKILEDSPVPVTYESGEVTLAGCKLNCHNGEAAAMFLAPHGDNLAFVVSASSIAMFQSITNVLPLHSPYDSFPDFVLVEEGHTWKGGNGILSLGYWDAAWNFTSQSSFHQCPIYIPNTEICETLW